MQNQIGNILKLVVLFTLLTISGSIGLILRLISFGYLLNFNRKYLVPFSSTLMLKVIGIQLELPKENPIKNGQYFITFNHNSYLDIFALTALGYTDTVFLLSEKTLKIIPLTLSALSIGVFYIPEKHNHDRRIKFFKKLEGIVNSKKINIAGSSEGVHDHHHGIDKFNKGVYHMATVCKLNIIPLFIAIPEESNPLNKYKNFKKGTIKTELLETINTQNWTLKDLVTNKDGVREIYVKKFNETHKISIT